MGVINPISIVLESKKSNPFSISAAIWIRRFTWAIIGIGALAVLLAGMLTNFNAFGSNDILVLGLVALKSILHVSYLYLIFWVLVFRDPLEKLYKQRLIFPIVLLVGYILYFSSAYVGYKNVFGTPGQFSLYGIQIQKILNVVTQIVFLLLYLLWLFRDIGEWQENRNKKRRLEICFWIIVEMVSLGLLILRVGYELELYHLPPNILMFADKDTAITLCLGLWILITIFNKFKDEENYRNLYEGYLYYNKFNGINPQKFSQTPSLLKSTILLDFGCGSGRRLDEIVQWLGINQSLKNGQINVLGYDNDEAWSAVYEDTLTEFNAKFVSSNTEIDYDKVGLIVLSHILYDEKAVSAAIDVLRKCNNLTMVVVRGASPNSIFTLTSMAFSLRILDPQYAHRWYIDQLHQIISKANLTRVITKTNNEEPDGIASQTYSLNKDSIDKMCSLLSKLYGVNAGNCAFRYLSALLSPGQVKDVPNNDLLYVFEIDK